MLVSCIMPTAGRRRFIPQALACFESQIYRDKELVILDDGADPIGDLIPAHPSLRYVHFPREGQGIPIGAKRNMLLAVARGTVICHWDDDDWSAPERIERQVALLESSGKAVGGFHSLLFYDETAGRAWKYIYGCPSYAAGTSLCYRREFWAEHWFPPENVGEDNDFVRAARESSQLVCCDGEGLLVARIHAGNSSAKSPEDGSDQYIPVGLGALPPSFPCWLG